MENATVGASVAGRRRRRLFGADEDSLTRDGDFNKLWFGQSVSVLGSEVTSLALPLTAILTLNATAAQIGLLTALESAATFLMLFAGVLVDRVRRRNLMIIADVGRGLLIGLIPVLALTDNLTMGALYVTVLLVGVFTVVFDLAYFAYLPSVVSKDKLMAANSRLQASDSFGRIVGDNFGGALVTIFRPAAALIIDALSFFASAVSLLLIRKPEPPVERPETPAGGEVRQVFTDIAAGIGPNYKNDYLRPLTLNSATANFLSQMILTLFIFYAARDLALSPIWIGVIFAAGSIGGVVGAIITSPIQRRLGFGRTFTLGMVAFRFLALTPFVVGPDQLVIPLLAATWFVTVIGVMITNISAGTLRQVVVPSNLQGRVLAAHRMLGYGILPIAALTAGVLGETIGVRQTIMIAAVLMPFTIFTVTFSKIPSLQNVEDAAPDEVTPAEAR
jgi:MFS family permease